MNAYHMYTPENNKVILEEEIIEEESVASIASDKDSIDEMGDRQAYNGSSLKEEADAVFNNSNPSKKEIDEKNKGVANGGTANGQPKKKRGPT